MDTYMMIMILPCHCVCITSIVSKNNLKPVRFWSFSEPKMFQKKPFWPNGHHLRAHQHKMLPLYEGNDIVLSLCLFHEYCFQKNSKPVRIWFPRAKNVIKRPFWPNGHHQRAHQHKMLPLYEGNDMNLSFCMYHEYYVQKSS